MVRYSFTAVDFHHLRLAGLPAHRDAPKALLSMREVVTASRMNLILRRPCSGPLEGRTPLIQPGFNFFTRSQVGVQGSLVDAVALDVESPGGLSPPGAPRSVREPLDSYGSRCSAVSMAELPVGKER